MFGLVPTAFAQGGTTDTTLDLSAGGLQGDFGNLDFSIPDLIQALLSLVLIVAAVVFFFMLIIGGIRWILSAGDKAQTEAARNQITAALVGLVIVFAAWAIASLLGTFLGIEIFNFTLPTVGGGSAGGSASFGGTTN